MNRLTRPNVTVDPSAARFIDKEIRIAVVSDQLLNLILNGVTLNSVCKDSVRHLLRQLYDALKTYEDTGMTPEQIVAMKQELKDEMYRHDRLQDFEVAEAQELAQVKAERDALLEIIRHHCRCDACKHEALQAYEEPCAHCQNTGGPDDNWEWQGAKDNNVLGKTEG